MSLEEWTPKDFPVVKKVLLKVDTPTANKTVYTRECIDKIVEDFNKEHKQNKTMLGVMSHEGRQDVFGIMEDMQVESGELICHVKPLDTRKGNLAHEILDFDDICIAPIAKGKFVKDKNNNYIVDPESYVLEAFTILPKERSAVHMDNKDKTNDPK